MNDVMLDLESLDTRPSGVIVSIGAVRFGPDGLGDRMHVVLERSSQTARGRTINPATVDFWVQQEANARLVFTQPVTPVEHALGLFGEFINDGALSLGDMRVWGNGSDFDNVMLGGLYETFGLRPPWRYSNNRCFRTLKNLVKLEAGEGIQFQGTAHNALDDAIYQAEMAIRYMNKANLAWR